MTYADHLHTHDFKVDECIPNTLTILPRTLIFTFTDLAALHLHRIPSLKDSCIPRLKDAVAKNESILHTLTTPLPVYMFCTSQIGAAGPTTTEGRSDK